MDLLDLYDRSTSWTKEKIAGATSKLDDPTPCDEWNVRALLNHCLHAQQIFGSAASGQQFGPPTGAPPELLGDDPVGEYETARQSTLEAFRQEGAVEKGGQILGIGFVDQLIHGWDIAKATGQDTTMPDGLAEAAYGLIEGRMDDDARRAAFFKPRISVPDDAAAQDKLLAYTGRQP